MRRSIKGCTTAQGRCGRIGFTRAENAKDGGDDGKKLKWKEKTSGGVGMCHYDLKFAVLNKTISLPVTQ
jgi:hypothetical protein